jgi:hypothetical protein
MDWTMRGDLASVVTGINYRRSLARQQGLEVVAVRLGPLHLARYCEQTGQKPGPGLVHGRPPVPLVLDASLVGISAVTRPRNQQRQNRDRSSHPESQA